jgi:Ca2+-binding EF-hand superfamily protein
MFTKVATAAVLMLSSCVALAQGRDSSALDHADANHDGKVTKQEYTDARAALFARMDRNGDGFIDDADSREGANERGQRAASALRGRIDSNGDGKVSKDEFINAPTMVFDKFDANKDGVLDATELEAARAASGKWRERRTQQ